MNIVRTRSVDLYPTYQRQISHEQQFITSLLYYRSALRQT